MTVQIKVWVMLDHDEYTVLELTVKSLPAWWIETCNAGGFIWVDGNTRRLIPWHRVNHAIEVKP